MQKKNYLCQNLKFNVHTQKPMTAVNKYREVVNKNTPKNLAVSAFLLNTHTHTHTTFDKFNEY